MSERRAWFAMVDGEPVFVGYFHTFEEAAQKAVSSNWIFDKKTLKKFVKCAKQELLYSEMVCPDELRHNV